MKPQVQYSQRDINMAMDRLYFPHPHYGDLRQPTSVVMPNHALCPYPKTYDPLYIHLTTTMRCNARCKGCINSSITFDGNSASPGDTNPERDAQAIMNLISREASTQVAVCFYGGEPLLVPDKIVRVMSFLAEAAPPSTAIQFMVYTNGVMIKKAIARFPELASRVWLYSVSIDGGHIQHDRIRVGAPLADIHDSLSALQGQFAGQVLMWSTLREDQSLTECFDEFIHLYQQRKVDHFFWHWVETAEPFGNLAAYARMYEGDLRRIMGCYCCELENGNVLPIAHINELVLYYLTGRNRGTSACGVEIARNYDIVGGKLQTCADLPPEYALGSINADGSLKIDEQDLATLVLYKRSLGCHQCGVHAYCGGRCPVQALTSRPDRLVQYCVLMRLHVAVVGDYVATIQQALAKSGRTLQDVYDRSGMYAQFTDVTP